MTCRRRAGSTVLTDAEQKKLEDDLIAARTRYRSHGRQACRPSAD